MDSAVKMKCLVFAASLSVCLSVDLLAATVDDVLDATVIFSPSPATKNEIIDSFQKSTGNIDVAMFYLSNDEIISSLCSIAQKGKVHVRLFVDKEMGQPAHMPKLERLSACGVEVHEVDLLSEGKMHLKCAVIDGKTTISGTANFTDYALQGNNVEDSLVVNSGELANLYISMMNKLAGDYPAWPEMSKDARPEMTNPETSWGDTFKSPSFLADGPSRICNIQHAESYFSPSREGVDRLLGQAEQASEIAFGMYLITDTSVVEKIAALAQKGCDISLLVDDSMLDGTGLVRLETLHGAGVKIKYYEDAQASMHLKTTIIDRRYVWTGSANLTSSAVDKNVEDMLMIDSPELANRYLGFLNQVATICKPYDAISLAAVQPSAEMMNTDIVQTMVGDHLPLTGPRTNYVQGLERIAFPSFSNTAQIAYLSDGDYFPALIDVIDTAAQSIFVSMYEIPSRTEDQPNLKRIVDGLKRAVSRGVYVYMVLFVPATPGDALNQAHSEWAEEWRGLGIDVRLATPRTALHEKIVVVDLCKILMGSHNWSEGALTGDRVYDSSALVLLPEQDKRWADYILGHEVISDMRSRQLWQNEITLLRHLASMSTAERDAYLVQLGGEKGGEGL